MPELTVNIRGLDELDKALSQLPEKLARNVARGSLRAGAKVIAEEAKRLAPVKTGRLRDSIRYSSGVRLGVPKARIKAGPGGKKYRGAFYAPFIEFGTARHVIPGPLHFGGKWHGSVMHPGIVRKPFMRPAADSQFQAAVQAFADYMRERLAKEGIEVPDNTPDDLED